MDEQSIPFAEWVGENVMVVLNNGNAQAGKLEEITEYGVVVRAMQGIWWTPADDPGPDEEGYVRSKHVNRLVSELYPWSSIFNVRILEPDEAVERGF